MHRSEAEIGGQFVVEGKVIKADGPLGIAIEELHVVSFSVVIIDLRQCCHSPALLSTQFGVVVGQARVHKKALHELVLGVARVLSRCNL